MNKARWFLIAGMILTAAVSRVLPHPPNFTPIGPMALFGGARFGNRALAFLVPLMAMFLSDLVIGLHSGMPIVYLCFALTTGMGFWLRTRRSAAAVAGTSLASALLFYVVTNFAVWMGGHGRLYPLTLEGLLACYIAALPFFRNMILGNLVYAAALFGGLALAERRFAALREPAPATHGA